MRTHTHTHTDSWKRHKRNMSLFDHHTHRPHVTHHMQHAKEMIIFSTITVMEPDQDVCTSTTFEVLVNVAQVKDIARSVHYLLFLQHTP